MGFHLLAPGNEIIRMGHLDGCLRISGLHVPTKYLDSGHGRDCLLRAFSGDISLAVWWGNAVTGTVAENFERCWVHALHALHAFLLL
jgi:hypothetical protein